MKLLKYPHLASKIGALIVCFLLSQSILAQKNTIAKSEITINGNAVIDKTESQIKNMFGDPIETSKVYWEMSEEFATYYIYSGMIIQFFNGGVDRFEINDSIWSITVHGVEVGDGITSLSSVFPKSYQNKFNNGLSVDIDESDKFIAFRTDDKDSAIIQIGVFTY